MPDLIQLLPDSIANQIAAGEVVQRPASAVKELIENALDAGATHIKLIVKDAGKTLIQVIDNGQGMSETDARMSLERHATSKIRTTEDLFRLHTMGFRGEALASIAAVSQMEMKTRLATEDLGTWLVVEGSDVKKQEPVATEKGTNISVKNLFFNIPVRRNFLKSNSVEMSHLSEEFMRLSLAHPHISFMLIQQDEVLFDLPPGKLSQRIVNLFGKNYQSQLAPVQEETSLMKISGYIGRPELARKKRGEQYIFVNHRFIRNNYLGHAVTSAYEGLLQENSFPFYALFIEIDPKHVDVNVHPTKTEIKFDDERTVYGVVWSAVKQALGTHNLAPTIDFADDVNLVNKLSSQPLSREQYYAEQFTTLNKSTLQNWEKLFEQETGASKLIDQKSIEAKPTYRVESSINQFTAKEKHEEEKGLFQFRQKYIVRASRQGIMFIDQQAAHERILFEKYILHLKGMPGHSQQSLFPQTLALSAPDFALVLEMEKEVHALGFRFEVFGKNTLLVSGVPAESTGNEKELLEGLIEQFKNQAALQLPLRENLAQAMAKRASIKAGQPLSGEEMEALAASLFSCPNPNYTPDGRQTFFVLDSSKIESYFSH
ncbi:MAG: DNA mismatch repair endonuclease MutL [Bacteroidetes bacterium]|nr:DNA mismatch repair endonuclease MutL [Bacteroidota bacterium]MBS1540992.1 DNA mismatch repair endonuclease MutL [Bacteroidota bacterium]